MRIILSTFLALALGYSAFIALVPPASPGVTVSQESLNVQTVERYRYRMDAPAVIVGSSLAARFASVGGRACVYDLSIAGGSPLTGLEVIVQKPVKPRTVLVEINLIDRPVDDRFVTRPLWFRQYLPLTWVENSPVNRLLTALSRLRGSVGPARPQVGALHDSLQLQQTTYDRPIPSEKLAESLDNLRMKIATLQQSGVKLTFFEMPVHPSLEQRVRARQIRNAIADRFPDIRLISYQVLSDGVDITTTDGVHLEEVEAKNVFARLGDAAGINCSR